VPGVHEWYEEFGIAFNQDMMYVGLIEKVGIHKHTVVIVLVELGYKL